MESTWFFTYWEAGDKATRASSIPAVKFFGFRGFWKKIGEWRPANELNKACVGGERGGGEGQGQPPALSPQWPVASTLPPRSAPLGGHGGHQDQEADTAWTPGP
jgi:hypothetical protein